MSNHSIEETMVENQIESGGAFKNEVIPEEIRETKKGSNQAIAVDQRTQSLVAKDNIELVRMIQIMMKGQAFPKTLDTEAKVIAAWQVAASLKLPPAVAIQNMAIIHGSVCLWGQLPKALAEATGELEDFRLILINKDQKPITLENHNLNEEVWGAVCQIKRKARSMNEYTFTEVDMAKAGLDKKTGPWKEYKKVMLSRRAIGHAIKFEFPDALMGVGIAEYDFNEAPDIKDVTPSRRPNSTLNDKLRSTEAINADQQEPT